jgi:nicotinamidase-related amidase
MALTTIDDKAALVVIDLQKGIIGLPAAHPVDAIVQRAASLAAAFCSRGLPVVLVNITGGAPRRTEAGQPGFTPPPDWADIVEELQPQAGDQTLEKRDQG